MEGTWDIKKDEFEVLVNRILQSGDVNKTISFLTATPLQHAVKINNVRIVRRLLLESTIRVDAGIVTPLMMACDSSAPNTEIIELLIEKGANVNAESGTNAKTPLMFCCARGTPEATRMLIENGARVNVRPDFLGNAPLTVACIRGNTEVIRVLIEKGANVNAKKHSDHLTALICVCISDFRNFEQAQMLINAGADVNAATIDNVTVLMRALAHSSNAIIRLLVQAGADVNTINRFGYTPLYVAVRSTDLTEETTEETQLELIEILLSNGQCMVVPDKDNVIHVNALDYIFRFDLTSHAIQMATLILENAVDAKHQIKKQLLSAVCAKKPRVVDLLLTYPHRQSHINKAFQLACEHGTISIMESLLAKGADIHRLDKKRNSALSYAAMCNNIEVIQYIFTLFCNKYAREDIVKALDTQNVEGKTPVFIAAAHGNLEVMKFLIDQGANFEKSDVLGQTPFFKSCISGLDSIAYELIKRGCDVNKPDVYGSTVIFAMIQDIEEGNWSQWKRLTITSFLENLLSAGCTVDYRTYALASSIGGGVHVLLENYRRTLNFETLFDRILFVSHPQTPNVNLLHEDLGRIIHSFLPLDPVAPTVSLD